MPGYTNQSSSAPVEIKNAADNTRAKVAATGSVAEGDSALAVQAPVLGATTGAAVAADGNATIQQYLRSLLKETGWNDDAAATSTGTLAAKLRGILTVLGATDNSSIDSDAAGTVKGCLRGLAKAFFARVPALGAAAAASCTPTVPATDCTYQTGYPTCGAATLLTVGSASAATGSAVTAGRYILVSTADVCWEQDSSPTAQWCAGDSKFLPAGVPFPCTLANQKVAGITAGAESQTLFIIPVS